MPTPLALTMVDGGGALVLRDSEEPAMLASPTTLGGTVEDATGVMVGASFATPPVRYQFDITSPIVATVFVDATFSEVSPGTVTGTVGEDDSLTVELVLKADLHIEVGSPVVLAAECTAAPVPLRLTSTAPYDREGTRRVTLRDPDFTIPAVPTTPGCAAIISGGVNERLAGGGHALEITMQGEVPEVRGAGEESTTSLTVEPAVSRAGHPVTLEASVTQADGGPELATGLVEFRDGGVVVGTVALDGAARASLEVSHLAVGDHALTARYLGDGVLYRSSVSPAVNHLVAAAPTVEVAAGGAAQIGGANMAATVTVANPEEFGDDIVNGRIDVTVRRSPPGTGQLGADRVVLERWDGGTWEPVTLTTVTATSVTGTLGVEGGFRLDAGTSSQVRLRLRFPAVGSVPHQTACGGTNPTCPGPIELAATLVQVDPEGTVQEALANDVHPIMLVESVRRATTLSVVGNAPRPHTARAGFTVEVIVSIGPNVTGVRPTGFAEVLLDGRLTPVRRAVDPFGEYSAQVGVGTGAIQGLILLPPDIEPGAHIVTVRYLGDQVFLPAEITTAFTVLPPAGHPFVCQVEALNAIHEFGANVTFDATVPATAVAGGEVALDVSDVQLTMNRPNSANPWPGLPNNVLVNVGDPQLEDISFGFGPAGTGQAASVTRGNATALPPSPDPADESQVDQTLTFGGPTGAVTLEGVPGEVVPVTLDEIVVTLNLIAPPIILEGRCTPVGEPMVLGEVEVAGTSVSVSPERAREGIDVVTVEARTFPAGAAGTVSFSSDLDGVLGTDAVDGGVASWTVEGLSPGRHVISAAFDASDPGVPDTSGTAVVTVSYSPRSASERFVVAARTDYLGSAEGPAVVADAAALDGGKTRTVYLGELSRSDAYLTRVVDEMYLDTLGREGDVEGAAFWVGRLRAGWSVARVGAHFYGSDEYVGRVGGTDEAWVRDLYEVLLGRGADGPGLAYWVGEVPRRGRGGVALAFFQTPESARARVVALYERFLGRRPSAADRDFWATRVIDRGDLVLAVELILSAEYGRRAENRFPLV